MSERRIPATMVTGFLGAGKTTLIRNLIRNARGRRIAIIVNEFGDMGFDGGLLADCGDDDCRPDQIVELTNGCICCTVADEFLPTMEALLARDPAPDHIVIETSGLALPQPLVQAFNWPSVKHRVTVDGVVTVVDAVAVSEGRFAPDLEAAPDPARMHDDPVEELFEDQLRCADLVVVSKADLVRRSTLSPGSRRSWRARRGRGCRRSGARAKACPSEILLGLSAAAEDDLKGRESHHELEGEEHDHDDFESFVVSRRPSRRWTICGGACGAALAGAGRVPHQGPCADRRQGRAGGGAGGGRPGRDVFLAGAGAGRARRHRSPRSRPRGGGGPAGGVSDAPSRR